MAWYASSAIVDANDKASPHIYRVTDLDKDGFDNFTAHLVNSTSDENHVPPWVAAYYLERLDNSESGFTRGSY